MASTYQVTIPSGNWENAGGWELLEMEIQRSELDQAKAPVKCMRAGVGRIRQARLQHQLVQSHAGGGSERGSLASS